MHTNEYRDPTTFKSWMISTMFSICSFRYSDPEWKEGTSQQSEWAIKWRIMLFLRGLYRIRNWKIGCRWFKSKNGYLDGITDDAGITYSTGHCLTMLFLVSPLNLLVVLLWVNGWLLWKVLWTLVGTTNHNTFITVHCRKQWPSSKTWMYVSKIKWQELKIREERACTYIS